MEIGALPVGISCADGNLCRLNCPAAVLCRRRDEISALAERFERLAKADPGRPERIKSSEPLEEMSDRYQRART